MENRENIIKALKSNFVLKKIFSCLDEFIKLSISNYNKYLQKKLNITIEDFIKANGIFKEVSENGIGKEYILYTNIVIFEGEYKNMKKNGKGKEFFENGRIKFEGEYFNGNRLSGKGYDNDGNLNLILDNEGKGKEYFKNGKIKFEGEYLNGKRWNGIGYNISGEKIFEIVNGKGKVKEYNDDLDIIFDGEYINGEKNGMMKEYNKNRRKLQERKIERRRKRIL